MKNYILAINPGSTSTKVALYENKTEIVKTTIDHSASQISKYNKIADQYDMRKKEIIKFLDEAKFDINNLTAVVGRGGLLPPVKSGAYKVNKKMVDRLKNNPVVEHASNLGGIIAFDIAENLNIPSYIYDSVAVDELEDVARISGIKGIERKSLSHALNMRAVAIKVSKELNKPYKECNIITAHLGGGITVGIHKKGKLADIVSDDEGPFSPERSGRIPLKSFMELCYKEEKSLVKKKIRGKGGLVSYLNTVDLRDVEAKISNGDKEALVVYEAMAYQISKAIGELSVVNYGDIDRIVITGGIAHSKKFTSLIKERVKFIAPVVIVPGENELESLAYGALRVLLGEEEDREYTE
ncbi:butyrate kinase [Helicovermis profundi]|uniref:Probable butyrate kinase n=1 Tax=Helicovermis profundi TaxID=3065157 RepID=A0AAU9E4J3_9FIRM|nr:butyrate kinase [Clostridia bacterium S502]